MIESFVLFFDNFIVYHVLRVQCINVSVYFTSLKYRSHWIRIRRGRHPTQTSIVSSLFNVFHYDGAVRHLALR